MSILNLENMKTSEKIMAMEELWTDLSKNINAGEFTPQWHIDVLNSREERVENNQSKFYDLDDVKKDLQELV